MFAGLGSINDRNRRDEGMQPEEYIALRRREIRKARETLDSEERDLDVAERVMRQRHGEAD